MENDQLISDALSSFDTIIQSKKTKSLNKKKKGARKELLCQKELEREGWRVIFKSMTVKLGPMFRGIDVADIFDVIAVKNTQWKFVSVKHYSSAQTKYPAHQSELRKFMVDHGLNGMSFELWIWHKPAWRGRGKNKEWINAHFEKIII